MCFFAVPGLLKQLSSGRALTNAGNWQPALKVKYQLLAKKTWIQLSKYPLVCPLEQWKIWHCFFVFLVNIGLFKVTCI